MPPPTQSHTAEEPGRSGGHDGLRSPIDYLSIGAGAAAFLYIYGGAALFVEYMKTHLPAGDILDLIPPRRFLVVGFPVVVGSVLLMVVLTWFIGRKWSAANDWFRNKHAFVRFALFLAASLAAVVVGALIAPFRLHYVEVTTKSGCVVSGSFISADAQGVHLADGSAASQGTPSVPLVLTISQSEVRSVDLQESRSVTKLPIKRSSAC